MRMFSLIAQFAQACGSLSARVKNCGRGAEAGDGTVCDGSEGTWSFLVWLRARGHQNKQIQTGIGRIKSEMRHLFSWRGVLSKWWSFLLGFQCFPWRFLLLAPLEPAVKLTEWEKCKQSTSIITPKRSNNQSPLHTFTLHTLSYFLLCPPCKWRATYSFELDLSWNMLEW